MDGINAQPQHRRTTPGLRLAIIIAAHNEAANIAATLQSCRGTDTFVADDNSTDDTAAIAETYTPYVLRVQRGGKGRALKALIDHFDICNQYDAFITLDGDSVLAPNAVDEFIKALGPGVAGAVGNMRNRQKSLFADWRALQYFQVFKMYRRGMEAINCIHVMCGTCAIWRTDLFKQLSWHDTPVEDMDWTYQLHRKRIGKVAYAAKADVYTLEPINLRDYVRQMLRWFRGYWLTTARYKAPFGLQGLDLGQVIIMFETCLNWARLLAVPLLLLFPLARWFVEITYSLDFAIIGAFALAAAITWRRPRLILLLPLFPFMFMLDTLINIYSFLTYGKLKAGVWISPRRTDQEVAA